MTVELIAGQNVGVRYSGAGKPALMIHCALAHTGAFAPLMGVLHDECAMTAFDLPGHGQTVFNTAKGYQDQAVEIAAAIAGRADQASHIMAHSFGATVALRLAVEHPDLVASLTLYEPVNFGLLASSAPEIYKQELRDNDEFVAACKSNDWIAAARCFLPRWGDAGFDALPEVQQQYMLKTFPMVVESFPSIYGVEPGKRMLDQLSDIDVPTLVIAGEVSPKVVHHNNAVIAGGIPNARNEIIAGAGHMGMITHAAKIGPMIRKIVA